MKKLLFIALIVIGIYYWKDVKPYVKGTYNWFSKTEVGEQFNKNAEEIKVEINNIKN